HGIHGRGVLEAEGDRHARGRRARPHVAQEDGAAGDAQHGVHGLLPVVGGQTELLHRAEGLDVEVDGRLCVRQRQIGCYAHRISPLCELCRYAPGAPSAMPLRLASPFSNSVPIMPSMLMKRPMAFETKLFWPSIAQVTRVPEPAGTSVKVATFEALKGFTNSRSMPTLLGVDSVIFMEP